MTEKTIQHRLGQQQVKYSYGYYNKIVGDRQAIRITEGCPNNCPYCYEPTEIKIFGIPEIVRNHVLIYDMNLLCKPQAKEILKELANKRVDEKVVYYELVCGIDYRFLTQELSDLLKVARIEKIRLAWDWFYKDNRKIKNAIYMLLKSGYKPNDIMVFMICNWNISYEENLKKLDLCKVWNVQVADCYYDNQTSPNINPIEWNYEQIHDFRHKVRKHNQLVNFKVDPE